MTSSIRNFGVAFPSLRLPISALASAWGGGAGRGIKRKPFCAFDEDPISLGIAAARSALGGASASDVRALFVGSTTLPYEEKPASATVVTAALGHANVRTVEIRGSCQAGLQALVLAKEYCSTHPGALALAIATDAPYAQPATQLEPYLSAAAAAFLIGPGPGLASIDSDSAVTIETFGSRFRRIGERNIRDLELRSSDQVKAVQALQKQFKPASIRHLAVGCGADLRKVIERQFGGVLGELWSSLGDAGAAASPVALAHALELATAGEIILGLAVDAGATALTLTRTESSLPTRASVMTQLEGGTDVDYLTYLKHRRLIGNPEMATE
jgi:hypothetical protein